MKPRIRCAHCRHLFSPNPRVKNQRYCSNKACQQARKRAWQREKLAIDADYRANQHRCRAQWCARNPDYYKRYRQEHSEAVQRNRDMQCVRNATRRRIAEIAKMDASKVSNALPVNVPGAFYLISRPDGKMDASAQEVLIIPMHYKVIAQEDSMDSSPIH